MKSKHLWHLHHASRIILVLLFIVGFFGYRHITKEEPISPGERFEVLLEECVDGDTAWFNINGDKTKVRFLYIDTPENTSQVEPYGKEATDFTNNLLSKAKKIELELNQDGDQYDKYDRMLAWVFVDDKLLQEEIAKQGFIKKYYDYGYEYTYKSIINDADQQAQNDHKGLYSRQ